MLWLRHLPSWRSRQVLSLLNVWLLLCGGAAKQPSLHSRSCARWMLRAGTTTLCFFILLHALAWFEMAGVHALVFTGSMHQNCPVCQENLFNSTSECRVLRCGHTMHRDCLRALVSRAQLARCPLCAVSITESAATWAQMDADIARSVMPEEYRDLEVPEEARSCSSVPWPFLLPLFTHSQGLSALSGIQSGGCGALAGSSGGSGLTQGQMRRCRCCATIATRWARRLITCLVSNASRAAVTTREGVEKEKEATQR